MVAQIQIVDWLFYDNGKTARVLCSRASKKWEVNHSNVFGIPSCPPVMMKLTLRKISLSEGELVNCRVMLIQPQGMTMKQLDIFRTKVMRKKTHGNAMKIHGNAAHPLGSPEGALTKPYRKDCPLLDDVEANQVEATASPRFPYPLKTRAPRRGSFMTYLLFGMERILIIKQNLTSSCFEVGYRLPGPKGPKQG